MHVSSSARRYLKVVGLLVFAGGFALFQNCSKVSFTPNATSESSVKGSGGDPTSPAPPLPPLPPPICNPLSGDNCDGDSGLIGNLYYMTNATHGQMFNGDLGNATLDDYYVVGTKVPNLVIMNRINITPRAWDSGFMTGAGAIVENGAGQKLYEWFALDLAGFIELPAGSYQLAQQSDDGMRVEVNGAVVLDDDGIHGPRWKCSTVNVSGGQKVPIRVGYFQGPRVQIAMNLLVRPASQASGPCSANGGWQEIPASAFSH